MAPDTEKMLPLSFSAKKEGDKKLPVELGISAGKDLLIQSKGNYKKKR